MSFIENCNSIDMNIWQQEYDLPVVENGTWRMTVPKGISRDFRIKSKDDNKFGYGTYKITFKTSGSRVAGVNFSTFFYNDQRPSGPFNEVDIPECFGNMNINQLSISSYRDTMESNKYVYFTSPINFEDGNYHTWKFIYLPDRYEFYVDNVLAKIWKNTDAVPAPIAKPPMKFYPLAVGSMMAGGYPPNKDWTVWIDKIEYEPITNSPYTISIEGGNYVARNSAGVLILSDTDSNKLLKNLTAYLNTGDVIKINTGVYLADTQMDNITKSVKYIGEGNVTIKADALKTNLFWTKGCLIENITFDANGIYEVNPLIQIGGDGDIIQNCTIGNSRQYNINSWYSQNFKIIQNDINKCEQYGIACSGQANAFSKNGLIAHNYITDCGQVGVKLRWTENTIVEKNTIDVAYLTWAVSTYNPSGIRFYHRDGPTVNCVARYNTIIDSKRNMRTIGIHVDPEESAYWLDQTTIRSSGMQIMGNHIQGTEWAIFLELGGVTVKGNKFVGNTYDVYIKSGTGNTLTGNLYDKSANDRRKLTAVGAGVILQGFGLSSGEICYTENGSQVVVTGGNKFKINGNIIEPDEKGEIVLVVDKDYTIEIIDGGEEYMVNIEAIVSDGLVGEIVTFEIGSDIINGTLQADKTCKIEYIDVAGDYIGEVSLEQVEDDYKIYNPVSKPFSFTIGKEIVNRTITVVVS